MKSKHYRRELISRTAVAGALYDRIDNREARGKWRKGMFDFRDRDRLIRLIIIFFGIAFGGIWIRFTHPTPDAQGIVILIAILIVIARAVSLAMRR
jgi:hypothetical protein